MEVFADSVDLILQPHQRNQCNHNHTLEQHVQTWLYGFSDYTICFPLPHEEHVKYFVLSLLILPFQLAESYVPFCISRLLEKYSSEDKVVLEDGVCLVLPYEWQLSYPRNIAALRSTKRCWNTRSCMDLQKRTHMLPACAASPPGFAVPEITTRNTIIETQWYISLRATINADRHVLNLSCLTMLGFFSSNDYHLECWHLTWNMTDMGTQKPLKTSKEINEVRFVGRHLSFTHSISIQDLHTVSPTPFVIKALVALYIMLMEYNYFSPDFQVLLHICI